MSRNRLIAAVVFTLVIISVLAVIVYSARTTSQATRTVWVAAHDVPAGTQLAPADVQAIQVGAASDQFRAQDSAPNGQYTRVELHTGDVVRPDDLVTDTQVQVSIALTSPPGLAAGNKIDIYLSDGSTVKLIGRAMTITATSPLTISVPSRYEADWVAISDAKAHLDAALLPGTFSPSNVSANAADAAIELSTGAQVSPQASPPSSPTPRP